MEMTSVKNARSNVAPLERDADGLNAVDCAALHTVQTDFTTAAADFQDRLAVKPREAAKLIGVGVNRVYELCNRRDFPAIHVGEHTIIIPLEALKRWLEQEAEREAAV